VDYNKIHIPGSIFQVVRSRILFLVIFIFFISNAISQAPLSVTRISDEIIRRIPGRSGLAITSCLADGNVCTAVAGGEPSEQSKLKSHMMIQSFYVSGLN